MTENHDGDEPDQRPRVPERIAVLEERMNTIRAETESAYDRLRADMAKTEGAYERLRADMAKTEGAYERLRADMASRDTEASKREIRLILAVLVIFGAGIAVLGFLIRLAPAVPPV